MVPPNTMKSLPRRAILHLKQHPRWLLAFVLLNMGLGAIELGMHPLFRQTAFQRLPAAATAEDRAVLSEMLQEQLPLRLAFLPVRNALAWGLFGLCLYYTALALGPLEPVRFVQVFALEVWAESTAALEALATLIRAWMDPSGSARGLIAPPFSLQGVLPALNGLELHTLLSSLNVFTVLYLAVLTGGMAVLGGFRPGRALLVVGCVWGVTVILNVAALSALRGLLQLRL